MKKDSLAAYIKQESNKGFSDSLIRKKLENAGYSSEEIDHELNEHNRKQHYHSVIGTIVDKESEKRWIVIVLGLLAVILITILLILVVQYVDWSVIGGETVRVDPEEEADCSIFTHRDKERCLMKVAAFKDNTSFCVNMTSKVMKYQCKTEVWNKNYCNFLILTNQSTDSC